MGLGFRGLSTGKQKTVFDNLFLQNKKQKKVFSFWLNRNLAQSNGGQLFIGWRSLVENKKEIKLINFYFNKGGSDPDYYTGKVYFN